MKRIGFGGLGVLAGMFLAISFVAAEPIYLDLDEPLVRNAAPPADCATWHELYPNYCIPHHQDAYQDSDGDGMISPCDVIVLDGSDFHIIWVGPTYFLRCLVDGTELVCEPTQPPSGGNPTCEIWHEVYPSFCMEHHVDDWVDTDGSQTLTVCDEVIIAGKVYHVERIGLDIRIEPGPTALDTDPWSRIKALYR